MRSKPGTPTPSPTPRSEECEDESEELEPSEVELGSDGVVVDEAVAVFEDDCVVERPKQLRPNCWMGSDGPNPPLSAHAELRLV